MPNAMHIFLQLPASRSNVYASDNPSSVWNRCMSARQQNRCWCVLLSAGHYAAISYDPLALYAIHWHIQIKSRKNPTITPWSIRAPSIFSNKAPSTSVPEIRSTINQYHRVVRYATKKTHASGLSRGSAEVQTSTLTGPSGAPVDVPLPNILSFTLITY